MRRISSPISSWLCSLLVALALSLGAVSPTTLSHAASQKADINSATLEELVAVTGIGKDTAQNILAYKKEHGNFSSMGELEAVNGVGKVRLEALQETFSVNSKKKGKTASSNK